MIDDEGRTVVWKVRSLARPDTPRAHKLLGVHERSDFRDRVTQGRGKSGCHSTGLKDLED